jgi:hypothetical protein
LHYTDGTCRLMSALASLKRYWVLAALVLLCALTVFAAFVAPSEIGKRELELEASAAATRIDAELNGEPGALIDAFARPAIAPHLSRIFDKLGYGHLRPRRQPQLRWRQGWADIRPERGRRSSRTSKRSTHSHAFDSSLAAPLSSWPSSPRLFDSTGAGDGVATASGSGGRALTWAGADASGETSCVSSGGLFDRACFQLCSTVRSGGSAGANSTGLGRATEGARALSGLTGSGAASISGADGAASIGASSRAGASFITGSADVVAWSASGFTAPPHFRPPASA